MACLLLAIFSWLGGMVYSSSFSIFLLVVSVCCLSLVALGQFSDRFLDLDHAIYLLVLIYLCILGQTLSLRVSFQFCFSLWLF